MNKQISLSVLNDELLQVRTKKKEFLEQIERIVPWGEWIKLINPCYYKGERGNKPYELELMLRIYLIQNLYDLADEATVAEVVDSRAFSDFCGAESSNQVPDGDTLGRFRNILVRNGLQEKLFVQVVEMLSERGLILKNRTIVDSTIISAPSSTRKQRKHDPYYLSDLPDGFEMVEHDSSSYNVYILYENASSEQVITFSQYTKEKSTPHYNTEHDNFEEIEINGNKCWERELPLTVYVLKKACQN